MKRKEDKELQKILASLDFWEIIQEICKFIKPFYDISIELAKEDVLFSTLFLVLQNLCTISQNSNQDSELILDLKEILKKDFDYRFKS